MDLGDRVDEDCGGNAGGAAIGFNYDAEDPIAAAIARKAAKEKKCALGGLLGAYVDDDDDEETSAAKEPPHPWKKLRDAATGHDYYWNQDDGSVSWTLPSSGADAKGKDADATAAGAETAANGDAGEAAPDGADTPVAKFEIPTPKPDVRTFADLLLAQANEAPGLRDAVDAVPPLVQLVLDIQRRVEDYERGRKGGGGGTQTAAAAASAGDLGTATTSRWRTDRRGRGRGDLARAQGKRSEDYPTRSRRSRPDRSKLAAAEVARRVAAREGGGSAAPRRASTDAMKPSTGGVTSVDRGNSRGWAAEALEHGRPRPAAAERRGRGRASTAAAAQARHRRGSRARAEGRRGEGTARALADGRAVGARQPRARPAPSRTFVSKPPSASEIDRAARQVEAGGGGGEGGGCEDGRRRLSARDGGGRTRL